MNGQGKRLGGVVRLNAPVLASLTKCAGELTSKNAIYLFTSSQLAPERSAVCRISVIPFGADNDSRGELDDLYLAICREQGRIFTHTVLKSLNPKSPQQLG